MPPTSRIGLGTWEMGDVPARRGEEIAALRAGVDLGLTTIDTAEMYGSGRAESLVGEAIEGRRDRVFLVTKVLPENASRQGVVDACERSLRRLATDRVDLYLLHWPGRHPLAETVAGFERLVADGKVLRWGVSNFDVDDLRRLCEVPDGGRVAADQVYYNLAHRGAERRVVPWCRERGVVVQAYTPLDQGRLAASPAVKGVAERLGTSASAVALAWTIRAPGVAAIAKTSKPQRVREFVGGAGPAAVGRGSLGAGRRVSAADGGRAVGDDLRGLGFESSTATRTRVGAC
jgi:diketogulonate reductase-like aldo/keto reductase